MGMVLVSEMFPLLSSLMDLGMRMEWWYGDGFGRRRPSSGKRGGAAGGGGGGGGRLMDGDVEEEGRAAEATPGVPKVPLLLCSFSWAFIFSSISASFCCLRMYSRVSLGLNWAWTDVEKET